VETRLTERWGRPRKRFGQHFLEAAWVTKLVNAVAPAADQTFLEIGPGRGALTRPLASRAAHVIAFEIDRELAAGLRDEALPNLTIVEGDFLDVTPEKIRASLPPGLSPTTSLRVVGNLPYNVAAPILFKLLDLYEGGVPLTDATVMLQREVAIRLLAEPGTRDYGILTILIRHAGDVRRLLSLPSGAFRPAPNVQSAVVGIRFHAPAPAVRDRQAFQALVQAIFTRRRKTLGNALLAFEASERLPPPIALQHAGIDSRRRPETLSLAELARLSDVYFESPTSCGTLTRT
jgi:16S rRNA (adenine1518-N6/adenine1519-N6)-dimethyltransferase